MRRLVVVAVAAVAIGCGSSDSPAEECIEGEDDCVVECTPGTDSECSSSCGTGGCESHETCSTCPQDCGECPEEGIIQIATGGYHSCAVTAEGELRCWGKNNARQTSPIFDSKPLPTVVADVGNVQQVALGYEFSCALNDANEALCWGANSSGQLGDGTSETAWTPTRFGGDDFFVSGLPTGTLGHWHSCLLDLEGAPHCAGWNSSGQIGNGVVEEVDNPDPSLVADVTGGVQITNGYYHSCARLAGGVTHCWGKNQAGQLGLGNDDIEEIPTAQQVIGFGTGSNQFILAGGGHSCAIDSAGDVYCWGANASGQLADGTGFTRYVPTKVSGPQNVIHIAAASGHTCVVEAGGRLWCWGRNTFGQLGIGTVTQNEKAAQEIDLTNVVEVACGEQHTCARRSDSTVWCWGANDGGQLGDGTTDPHELPAAVTWE